MEKVYKCRKRINARSMVIRSDIIPSWSLGYSHDLSAKLDPTLINDIMLALHRFDVLDSVLVFWSFGVEFLSQHKGNSEHQAYFDILSHSQGWIALNILHMLFSVYFLYSCFLCSCSSNTLPSLAMPHSAFLTAVNAASCPACRIKTGCVSVGITTSYKPPFI